MDLPTTKPTTKIEQLIQLSNEYSDNNTILIKGKVRQQLNDLLQKSKNNMENKNEQRNL